MRFFTIIAACSATASAASIPRANTGNDTVLHPTYDALFDGKCFYPKPAANFDLTSYLGRWYQVAGYAFGPTTGRRCVNGEYSFNDNGTVRVVNMAKVGDRDSGVVGYASLSPASYGKAGVLKVEFPGLSRPAVCDGPNYIVQDFRADEYSIVQSYNWTTLFILSRERQPGQAKIDEWISKAVNLGSDPAKISLFNQTGC